MENFDELLKKYADFIVRVGVNPQPGQTLIIRCPLEAAPLARLWCFAYQLITHGGCQLFHQGVVAVSIGACLHHCHQ